MKAQLRLAGGRRKLGRNGFSSDIPRECADPPEYLRDLRDLGEFSAIYKLYENLPKNSDRFGPRYPFGPSRSSALTSARPWSGCSRRRTRVVVAHISCENRKRCLEFPGLQKGLEACKGKRLQVLPPPTRST